MAWLNSWMTLWLKLLGKAGRDAAEISDPNEELLAESLLEEIRLAHRDWVNAHRHFEYAVGKDQIDYAIYSIEAAEKRYEMLLRNAKNLHVAWTAQRGEHAG
jgi:hypothetical protein